MKTFLLILITWLISGWNLDTGAQNFQWAKNIGGNGAGTGTSIAFDMLGNVYTAGNFDGTLDFDPGVGIFNMTSQNNRDFFVSKFDALGNFVWAKVIGGVNDPTEDIHIAVDVLGNVYATGIFEGTIDFDPGIGVYYLTSEGKSDVFIAKLNASGNFAWAKRIGGIGMEHVTSIAIDASDNICIAGRYQQIVDFDPGVEVFNLSTPVGNPDSFLTKLDELGNFIWAKSTGAIGGNSGTIITFDVSGNVISTGSFYGTVDFDPGQGIFNLHADDIDIFVSKLDALGNFLWAKCMGGKNVDEGKSIATDASDNVYTIGYFNGTADFDPSAEKYNLTSIGYSDIFISKLDALGNFVWAKGIGGTSLEYGNSIAIDALGNVVFTGIFWGTADFDPGAGILNLSPAGEADIFISKFDASGNFIWAKNFGGTGLDCGMSTSLDASGNVYTTGFFSMIADFDPGAEIFNLTSAGESDIFVSKLSASTDVSEELCNSGFEINSYCSGTVFSVSNNQYQMSNLHIFNVVGKNIYSIELPLGRTEVDISTQLPGIYLYCIQQGTRILKKGKIIIE